MPEPSKLQRSTESFGVGQSGYTAGRTRDPALELEIQTRYVAYREGDEDEILSTELETDDRWTGRGGPLVPVDNATEKR